MILWGIDLGGTKIEGVILASDTKEVLFRERVATEGDQGYDHVLNQVANLIEILKSKSGLIPEKIGMGTPGSTDPETGLLKNCNAVHLNGKPLKKDLEDRLQIPFTLANDANCFALAETHMGIVQDLAPDAKVVFGVIMGSGVGGGLVVNGQIINGAHGIGGEWGHNFLDESGGPCYCGKTGCTETVIAGPHLERFYDERSGHKKGLRQIMADRATDPIAQATYDRLIHFYGKGISTIINMIDPDVIVIGGGVGNIDELYTEGLESVKKHVFNTSCQTKILKPKLGDSAGVFGAAYL
ncbi:ROK family protein [Reichenbachiella ulvae]|uniref:ROK family protein n=1 Tax=Reichenbachiella ulvae TaxID=2980104 RepID=A0ABT3CXU3_9BACT|nr:ROK family protein [Reichenbachiella ulvae]MCV9388305.1 ROK family protein [Reichenbachiella ulvae]